MHKQVINQTQPKIIINADDFGYCEERSRGICELLEFGHISSTTAMVNSPHLHQHIDRLKQLKNKRQISIGLHLNLTEFKPMSSCPCLEVVDLEKGQFKGKNYLYENIQKIQKSIECLKFIQEEINLQILAFIKAFGYRPSHIDGHNHVHLIPSISALICEIAAKYGIYRVRIPQTKLFSTENSTLSHFNEIFISNTAIAKQIYQKNNFISTSYFIGLQTMGPMLQPSAIMKHLPMNDGFIQIMVHPGYKEQAPSCPFSNSQDRQIEMNNIKSTEFSEFIRKHSERGRLWNFNQLHTESTMNSILIFSKMVKGSGNLTTSLRYQTIFQQLGYKVYLLSRQDITEEEEVAYLANIIMSLRINLIVGVNLNRTATIIHQSVTSKEICYRIPYILVIAGTDANSSIVKQEGQRIGRAINNAQVLVSLNQQMKLLIMKKYPQLKKQIEVIPQSTTHEQADIHIMEDRPYIIFPTSFRKVKCVHHILPQINALIQQYGINVYICGPVIDQSYYECVAEKLGKVKYIGNMDRNQYMKYLNHSSLMINTSESQGVSCAILEGLESRVPVIVRSNEGNRSIIKHKENGLLYEEGKDFMEMFKLINHDQELKSKLIERGYACYQSMFSLEREQKQYEQIMKKYSRLHQIDEDVSIQCLLDVHSIQTINLELFELARNWNSFKAIDKTNVLQIGCGCGVFPIKLFQNSSSEELSSLTMTEVCPLSLSNAYTNIVNLPKFSAKFSQINFLHSDMFQNVPQHKFSFVIANLPQTPFQLPTSRPDKNAGKDGLKYYRQIIHNLDKYTTPSARLLMLYLHIVPYSELLALLEERNRQIEWESECRHYKIDKSTYNEMEDGLSDYLQEMIKKYKSEVQIEEDHFVLPASMIVIRKK